MNANDKKSLIDNLSFITEQLLTENHPGKLRDAAINLHSLFSGISGVSENSSDPVYSKVTVLPTGKAVSPAGAARCIWDFMRTAKFLRGVHLAIIELQKRFPQEKIEILYAGCGPFATLAVPLMAKFSSEEIGFTLLDIHEISLESAAQIVKTFDLESYIDEYVQADAAEYAQPKSFHLIISETMQKALINETQVSIMKNLSSRLKNKGVFVPQKILIEACLYDPKTEFVTVSAESGSTPQNERLRINLGRIAELNAEKMRDASEKTLAPVSVKIPDRKDKKLRLMLSTTITVFDSITLDEYESSITCPKVLDDIAVGDCEKQLEFAYNSGSKPGFRYHYV